MKRHRQLLIVSVVGVYALGYVLLRVQHVIVHTSMNAGDEYTLHDVVAGDAKLASPNGLMAGLYTPLRSLERGGWYLAKPVGSRYP